MEVRISRSKCITKKSSGRLKASQILQKDAKFMPLLSAAYFGVRQEIKMDIIITDLTRFAKQDIVCIAGINPSTNECVRPLPYLPTNECRRLNILPGAILHGNFTTPPITAPHTEDRNYQGKLSFKLDYQVFSP